MKRNPSYNAVDWQHLVTRNAVHIAVLGAVFSAFAAIAGMLTALLLNPDADSATLWGWAFMGVVTFSFPIVMWLIWRRQARAGAAKREKI